MRYKLTIEYDGTSYCGFQKQPSIPNKSIEKTLEDAIFKLSQERTKIVASGRTDAGVHALGQVVHFNLNKNFKPYQIVSALNHYLGEESLAAIKCEIVDENFHARFSGKLRHYRYIIINRPASLVLQKNRAWHIPQPLNSDAMRLSSKFLLGKHDFSSFRDADCEGRSPIKTIEQITITQSGEEIFIDISANAFLHHMVRTIMGTLLLVGLGKITPKDMQKILEAKDRTKAGRNAPAYGLYFLRVDYH